MQATFSLLEEMTECGAGPTVATFNTLMDAATECDDSDAAVRLFNQMVEAGFTPDNVTYTVMMKVNPHDLLANLFCSAERL